MSGPVSNSLSFVFEIEVVFATDSVKWSRAINREKFVIYVMFFAALRENCSAKTIASRRFKLSMNKIV